MAIYNTNISGGLNTKDCTADASKILDGYTAGVGKEIVTGTMADNGDVSTAIVDGVLLEGFTSGGTIESMAKINGTVRTMTVNSNSSVKKGDFVEFRTNYTWGSNINLLTTTYSGYFAQVAEISENKVLIVHPSSTSSSGGLNAAIVTLTGTTATLVSDTKLISGCYYAYEKIVRLEDNRVFILYFDTSYCLYGCVCRIVDDTIEICSTTQVTSALGDKYVPTVVRLQNNIVVVVYGYYDGSKYYTKGRVCAINNDDTITLGTAKSIISSTSYYCAKDISATYITEKKVAVIATNYVDGSSCIYGAVITVNDDYSLSSSTASEIYGNKASNAIYCIATLNNGKIVIGTTRSSSNSGLNMKVATISGSTFSSTGSSNISYGTTSNFDGNTTRAAYAKINNYNLLVPSRYDSGILFGIVHISEDGSVTYDSSYINISSQSCSQPHPYVLSNGKCIIVWGNYSSSASYVLAIRVSSTPNIQHARIGDVNGIALDDGSAGDTVRVYLPNN